MRERPRRDRPTELVALDRPVGRHPSDSGLRHSRRRHGRSASADESAPVEMMLEDLDFIVEDALRLEFVVVGDAPDIAPPTTTALPPATTSTTVPDDSPRATRRTRRTQRADRLDHIDDDVPTPPRREYNLNFPNSKCGDGVMTRRLDHRQGPSIHPAIETRVGASPSRPARSSRVLGEATGHRRGRRPPATRRWMPTPVSVASP